jgi:hypothetical protein
VLRFCAFPVSRATDKTSTRAAGKARAGASSYCGNFVSGAARKQNAVARSLRRKQNAVARSLSELQPDARTLRAACAQEIFPVIFVDTSIDGTSRTNIHHDASVSACTLVRTRPCVGDRPRTTATRAPNQCKQLSASATTVTTLVCPLHERRGPNG